MLSSGRSVTKRVLLLLCTDCLLRVGALRNAHLLLRVGSVTPTLSRQSVLRNAHSRANGGRQVTGVSVRCELWGVKCEV
jgi:hypothetical protein